MAEVGVQRVLTVINQCFAFKIPPQTSAAGHRADSWPSEPAWTGRLVISSIDDNALIELKDATTGVLFAACPIKKDGPPAVQKGSCTSCCCRDCVSRARVAASTSHIASSYLLHSPVVDSSRYFVLRVVDQNSGRHAFIGIAFENRSDAFDFNVAMDDFNKELQREQVAAEEALKAPVATKDYSLKQGEKIKIKINTTRKSRDTGDDGGDDSGFGASSSSSKANSGNGGTADLLGFSGSQSAGSTSSWETF